MKRQAMASLGRYRLRAVLWICLLGLTIVILLYPVSISPDYPLPVQSIHIFSNFPLFTVLFYIWVSFLLILLFSGKEQRSEKLTFSMIFVLVFSGFWVVISPGELSGDGLAHMAPIRYISDEGRIPSGLLSYGTIRNLYFPALHFVNVVLSEVCELPIFTTRTIFLLINLFVFTLILFTTFLNILKSPFYASAGVILTNPSSILLVTGMTQLIPIALATTYIAVFILLLSRTKNRLFETWQEKILFAILTVAATTSYIFAPTLFSFVLLSVYLLHRLCKEKEFLGAATAIMPIVFAISWEVYFATYYLNTTIISGLVRAWEDITRGRFFLATEQYLRANIGVSYPWWGNVTRFFWWFFVFGLGSALMLKNLLSFKNHAPLKRVQIGGFVGVVSIVLVGALGSPGASHGGFVRFLWLAPFFLVPSLMKFIFRPKVMKYGLAFIFLALLLFSFPTFLTNMDTLSYSYIYSQEHWAGRFIEATYGRGEGLYVYGFGGSFVSAQYYAPKAEIIGIEAYNLIEEEVWNKLHGALRGFLSSGKDSLFISVEGKVKPYYELHQGIPPDHPEWTSLESRLSLNNMVYNNGLVLLYTPER